MAKITYSWSKKQDEALIAIYPTHGLDDMVDYFIKHFSIVRASRLYVMRMNKINKKRIALGLPKIEKDKTLVSERRKLAQKRSRTQKKETSAAIEMLPPVKTQKRQLTTKTKITRRENEIKAELLEASIRSNRKLKDPLKHLVKEENDNGMEAYRVSSKLICFLPRAKSEEERQENYIKLREKYKNKIW